jgi:hypothetical protein
LALGVCVVYVESSAHNSQPCPVVDLTAVEIFLVSPLNLAATTGTMIVAKRKWQRHTNAAAVPSESRFSLCYE